MIEGFFRILVFGNQDYGVGFIEYPLSGRGQNGPYDMTHFPSQDKVHDFLVSKGIEEYSIQEALATVDVRGSASIHRVWLGIAA